MEYDDAAVGSARAYTLPEHYYLTWLHCNNLYNYKTASTRIVRATVRAFLIFLWQDCTRLFSQLHASAQAHIMKVVCSVLLDFDFEFDSISKPIFLFFKVAFRF